MAPIRVVSRTDVEESTLADIAKACNTPVNAIEDVYECTPSQIRMIYESKPEIYQFVLSFGPDASIERFCEALQHVILLNPTLRTRIAKCKTGTLQVVLAGEGVHRRLSGNIDDYLHETRAEGSWLGVPLFRSAFIGRKFVATIHHAVMDYWSWFTMLNVDVAAAYYGQSIRNRPPFKEFVSHCSTIDDSAVKSFWAPRFRGVPAIFPRNGLGYSEEVRKATTRKMAFKRTTGEEIHAQMPYFIEAAWAMTSSIYTGQDSIVYGYLLSGRSSSSRGLNYTLGPTVTEIPVQVNLRQGITVGQLIKDRAVSLRQLQANPAVHCGIDKIVLVNEASKHAAAYRTLLNILPELPVASGGTDVKLERMLSIEAPFPLHLIFTTTDEGFLIDPRFNPEAISEIELNQVLDQFEHTLQSLAQASPTTKLSSLRLLNPHDHQSISIWNKRVPQKPGKCVHEEFRAQARVRPDAKAIEAHDGSADYRSLDQISDRLAHELSRKGVSRNVAVAFIFETSLWAAVAILGILKAGGICVPIDKNYSNEDKAAICSRVNAKLILKPSAGGSGPRVLEFPLDIFSFNSDSTKLPLDGFDSTFLHTSRGTNMAYILFSKGVTGEWRGAMFEHGNLVTSLKSQAQKLNWQPGCRMLHIAPYVSSTSICEILGTLLSGGCLCVPSGRVDEESLSDVIQATQPNWAILSSSELHNLSPSATPSLESVLCIGSTFQSRIIAKWSSSVRLFNGWVADEASLLSTIIEVTSEFQVGECMGLPVGLPVGCSVWIVRLQNIHDLAPIGTIGEVLIEGAGVAVGYLGDNLKAAASFITPPDWAAAFEREGSKFYRTGDLGRYNSNGSLSLIGKQSNRVNIKGRTVQLEELERTLLRCDALRDVVILPQISSGRTQIVAIVCLADARLPSKVLLHNLPDTCQQIIDQNLMTVKAYAKSALPVDVSPSIWMVVEKMPRMNSQNLDRAGIRQWLRMQRS